MIDTGVLFFFCVFFFSCYKCIKCIKRDSGLRFLLSTFVKVLHWMYDFFLFVCFPFCYFYDAFFCMIFKNEQRVES